MVVTNRDIDFFEPFLDGGDCGENLTPVSKQRMISLATLHGLCAKGNGRYDGANIDDSINRLGEMRDFLFHNFLFWKKIESITGCKISDREVVLQAKKANLDQIHGMFMLQAMDARVNAYSKKNVGSIDILMKQKLPKDVKEWEFAYIREYGEKFDGGFKKFVFKILIPAMNWLVSYVDKKAKLTESQQAGISKCAKEIAFELLIDKTFQAYIIQEAIFLHLSERSGLGYLRSDELRDSMGIDGFLGLTPLSIKPINFRYSCHFGMKNDNIPMINYSIFKKGVLIRVPEDLEF